MLNQFFNKTVIYILLLIFTFGLAGQVFADSWRTGKVKNLFSSYDGEKITFVLKELSSDSQAIDYSKCTCDSSWTHLCLNPQRRNYDKEYSMLLTAYTTNTPISVIFNENVCFVTAIYLVEKP